MALILNNMSGSSRGYIHNESPIIAVTGALVFSKHGGFDATQLDEEVYFYVDGTHEDGASKSLFAGDMHVSGGLVVEEDSLVDAKLFLSGAPETDLEAATKKYVDDAVGIVEGNVGNILVDEGYTGSETDKALTVNATITEISSSIGHMEGYVDGQLTDFLEISGSEANNVFGTAWNLSGGDTVNLKGTADQIELHLAAGEVRVGLPNNVIVNEDLTVQGDLTVNGDVTTINTENLLVEDPIIAMASNANTYDWNGGIAIMSGASDADLVIGRVASDVWGVGKMPTNNGTVTSVTGMDLVRLRAGSLQVGNDDNTLTVDGGDLIIAANQDLAIDVQANGKLDLKADGVEWLKFDMENNAILPAVDSALDLGSLDFRFANMFTGDLHLRNERGNWTLIEEEEFISFRNNDTGKRYKMLMEDITGTDTYGPGLDGEY